MQDECASKRNVTGLFANLTGTAGGASSPARGIYEVASFVDVLLHFTIQFMLTCAIPTTSCIGREELKVQHVNVDPRVAAMVEEATREVEGRRLHNFYHHWKGTVIVVVASVLWLLFGTAFYVHSSGTTMRVGVAIVLLYTRPKWHILLLLLFIIIFIINIYIYIYIYI